MGAVAIVYWKGQDQTEAMGRLIARGAADAGASVTIFEAMEFSPHMIDSFGAIAIGCPAMDVEQLDKSNFEPMIKGIDNHVQGRAIALFGSFDGETEKRIDGWEAHWLEEGADSVTTLKVEGAPEGVQADRCLSLGASLAREAQVDDEVLQTA